MFYKKKTFPTRQNISFLKLLLKRTKIKNLDTKTHKKSSNFNCF